MKHDTGLIDHLSATAQTYEERTGKRPGLLAIGRWDARELAHVMADALPDEVTALGLIRGVTDESEISLMGAEVMVDFRVGRMAGALWWHP